MKKNFLPQINKINSIESSDRKNMFQDMNIVENGGADGMSIISEDEQGPKLKTIDKEWDIGGPTKRNTSRLRNNPEVIKKV